jgi:hypothetical protein
MDRDGCRDTSNPYGCPPGKRRKVPGRASQFLYWAKASMQVRDRQDAHQPHLIVLISIEVN